MYLKAIFYLLKGDYILHMTPRISSHAPESAHGGCGLVRLLLSIGTGEVGAEVGFIVV